MPSIPEDIFIDDRFDHFDEPSELTAPEPVVPRPAPAPEPAPQPAPQPFTAPQPQMPVQQPV